jgi:hypothetical protein
MRYEMLSGLGGHPELEDAVYDGDKMVGRVGFFYRQTSQTTYEIQLDPIGEKDPVDVRMEDVKNAADQVIGRRFVISDVKASEKVLAGGTGKPSIVIANNQ